MLGVPCFTKLNLTYIVEIQHSGLSADIQPTNGPSSGPFMLGMSEQSRVFHWMSIYMPNMSRYVIAIKLFSL